MSIVYRQSAGGSIDLSAERFDGAEHLDREAEELLALRHEDHDAIVVERLKRGPAAARSLRAQLVARRRDEVSRVDGADAASHLDDALRAAFLRRMDAVGHDSLSSARADGTPEPVSDPALLAHLFAVYGSKPGQARANEIDARAEFLARMDRAGLEPLPRPCTDDEPAGPTHLDAHSAREDLERRMASLGTAPIIHEESFDG